MARNKKTAPAVRLGLPADYAEALDARKTRLREAQTKAMPSVNRELIALCWDIGRWIVDRQEREGWGNSVEDWLAGDLQKAFPGTGGFSAVNVLRTRAFFLAYRDVTPRLSQPERVSGLSNSSQAVTEMTAASLPSPVAEISWGHNQVLLFKLKDPAQRLWYAAKILEYEWRPAVLTLQIECDLVHSSRFGSFPGSAGECTVQGAPPRLLLAPCPLERKLTDDPRKSM